MLLLKADKQYYFHKRLSQGENKMLGSTYVSRLPAFWSAKMSWSVIKKTVT